MASVFTLDGSSNGVPRTSEPPAKKSRFKRPSWASTVKQAPAPESNEEDTFNRSKETLSYLKRQQAGATARAGSEEKGKGKQAGRNVHNHNEPGSKKDAKPNKKRRLSSQGPEASGSESDYASADEDQDGRATSKSVPKAKPNAAPAPATRTSRRKPKETIIVDLNSEDEEKADENPNDKAACGNSRSPKPKHHRQTDEHAPDEKRDFPLSDNHDHPTQVPTPRPTISPTPTPTTATPSKPDPTLTILIHSRIPNTAPLMAKRGLNQRLREVQDAWLLRQTDLTPAQKSEVFLTWRGVKVFPFSSCKHLGIDVNEVGEATFKGRGRMEAPSEENAQIEFEAVTAEILERDKREREAEAKKKAVDEGREETPKEGLQKKEGIKIILRAGKGYQDFKLLVKPVSPHSQCSNIIWAFADSDIVAYEICTDLKCLSK